MSSKKSDSKVYGIITFYNKDDHYGYMQQINHDLVEDILNNVFNNSDSSNEEKINSLKETLTKNRESVKSFAINGPAAYYFELNDILNLNDISNIEINNDSKNVKNLTGALVTFNPIHSKDVVKANNIEIVNFKNELTKNSDWNVYSSIYLTCPHCSKSMVPNITSNLNQPLYAVCPLCGEVYKDLRTDKYKFRQKMLPVLFIIFVIIAITSLILN